MTEVYNAKRSAPPGGAKADRITLYGAMRFEEYAAEWKTGQRDLEPASVVNPADESGADPHAEVHPVLDDLPLGNSLEVQARADAGGVTAGERRAPLLREQGVVNRELSRAALVGRKVRERRGALVQAIDRAGAGRCHMGLS